MPRIVANTEGTDPVELYYEVHGTGEERVLFINGLGSILSLWDPQIEFFSQMPEFSICLFDNRGSGFSSSPLGRYTTRMMARDAMALLAHLGWTRVHIVALSMGGMIAQELAYMLGDDVKSLCLISTLNKFNGISVSTLLNAVTNITPQIPTIESYCSMTVDILFPEHFVERFSITGFQSTAGRAGQQIAAVSHYFDERLNHLRKHRYPILVIAGDQDQVVRQPVSSQYLAEKLNARLEIYPGGGHALRLQDPEWLNLRVLENIRAGIQAPSGANAT
ncbi:hypothetical protein HK105_202486 [Polyrhizophydium stewartii]|uniref:AB hydrolase-1 domain-containing protein n=1 Tax=Polyrhizophydium stewartii TaxID=2732419 RepID=A0ABR4NF06_9FUNG